MTYPSKADQSLCDDRSDIRRRRLLFRCWHRGTQESDLLLGSFADIRLAGLDHSQLDRFESLLDCSDPDLFDWILAGIEPPTEHDHEVLRMLRGFWAHRAHGPRQSGHSQTPMTP